MDSDSLRRVVAEWLEEFELPSGTRRNLPFGGIENLNDILVLVGPRRSGKTYYMYQLIRDLLSKGNCTKADILFVDFEDFRFSGFEAGHVEKLFVIFRELGGRKPAYLFFDEVQRLEGWDRVLRTLHNKGEYKIIVSGSNSQLLSSEITTRLHGRFRDLLILPYSFAELLQREGIAYSQRTPYTSARGDVLRIFDAYLSGGGFPAIVSQASLLERGRTLQSYYRTIFYKDVVERYNIRARRLLEQVMSECLACQSNLFSISKFEKQLKHHGQPGSKRTIANYLSHLEDAFFIITNEKFSFSQRRRSMNPVKTYLIDNGFSSLLGPRTENRGDLLENAVALHLFRNEREMFYSKQARECDFVIVEGTKPSRAIQVCWELNQRTQRREVDGLMEAMKTFGIGQALILTYDQTETINVDGKSVPVLPVWRWLVDEKAL